MRLFLKSSTHYEKNIKYGKIMGQRKREKVIIMVIVFIIDNYKSLTNGTMITAHRFAEKLRTFGHEVRIVTNDVTGEDIYTLKTRYIPVVSDVAKGQNITFSKPNKKVLKSAFEGADVIHAFMPWKTSKEAIKLAKKLDIPVTSAFHVQPENVIYGAGMKRFKKVLSPIIYKHFKRFFKKTRHVHCPSNFIANELKKNKYPNQLHVISNGIDDDFIYKEKTNKTDKYQIMMIGRLSAEKRQDVILHAVAKSKYKDNIQLTFAGAGPKKKSIESLAKKLGVSVEFGFFNKEELIKKIHEQDLYIHAADIEIEAISCLEAISSGRVPIIANSPKSATPQFALDERSLFEAGNPDSLKEKMEYWLEHEEERKRMEKIYANSSSKYHLNKAVKRFEEMLQEAIKDHKNNKLSKSKTGKKITKQVKKTKTVRTLTTFFYYLVVPILMVYNKIHLKVKIKNKKNLKQIKGGAVLVSNHVHTLDSVMLGIAAFPKKVVFTGMKENFEKPVIGQLVRALGSVPTPETILENRIFFNELSKQVRKGKYIHFFPEGELIKEDEKLRNFKKGAFKLAVDSSVPIIPIRINFQDKEGRKKKKIILNVGKPMFPDYSLNSKNALEKLKIETEEAMNKLI